MTQFHFTILQPRVLDYDKQDLSKARRLESAVPSYRRCIGCGGCSATCSTGGLSPLNIRKAHLSFSRGIYDGLDEALKACMLCGKCMLVCPRGVNTRSLIINMRHLLAGKTHEEPDYE